MLTSLKLELKQFTRRIFRAFDRQLGTETDETRFSSGIVLRKVDASRARRILSHLRSDRYRKGEIDLSLPLQLPLEYQPDEDANANEQHNKEQR
jgi:hypothetical protein